MARTKKHAPSTTDNRSKSKSKSKKLSKSHKLGSRYTIKSDKTDSLPYLHKANQSKPPSSSLKKKKKIVLDEALIRKPNCEVEQPIQESRDKQKKKHKKNDDALTDDISTIVTIKKSDRVGIDKTNHTIDPPSISSTSSSPLDPHPSKTQSKITITSVDTASVAKRSSSYPPSSPSLPPLPCPVTITEETEEPKHKTISKSIKDKNKDKSKSKSKSKSKPKPKSKSKKHPRNSKTKSKSNKSTKKKNTQHRPEKSEKPEKIIAEDVKPTFSISKNKISPSNLLQNTLLPPKCSEEVSNIISQVLGPDIAQQTFAIEFPKILKKDPFHIQTSSSMEETFVQPSTKQIQQQQQCAPELNIPKQSSLSPSSILPIQEDENSENEGNTCNCKDEDQEQESQNQENQESQESQEEDLEDQDELPPSNKYENFFLSIVNWSTQRAKELLAGDIYIAWK